MTGRPIDIAERASLLADTTAAQSRASDPAASAWVSANAGAGKTHVLKMRVLRLMLAGTSPERILCLTYTKAAAAEMADRVFKELAGWATMSEPDLDEILAGLVSRQPNADEKRLARQLFARAIETPGGLKVQTIHAFCERLLQRFPLEAGISPGFDILDDLTTRELLTEARAATLVAATAGLPADAPLAHALKRIVAFAGSETFEPLIEATLADRAWLRKLAGLRDELGVDGLGSWIDDRLRGALAVRPGIAREHLEHEMAAVIDGATLARALRVLASTGQKSQEALADTLTLAHRAQLADRRIVALRKAFLTNDGKPRADRFVTNAVRDTDAPLYDELLAARDAFAERASELARLNAVEATVALYLVADDVMQRFTAAKTKRGALDFEDLISRTADLLSQGDQAAWVLYKLDGGLDHILVDEAQDTSPAQWRIVDALSGEFHAAASAGKSPRTVFAVGDEKQSIYSFQGAAPEMFDAAGKRLRAAVEAAGHRWNKVDLLLSFRTVPPLLDAIDRVFSDPARTPGLGVATGDIHHQALRLGQAGIIEIWDTEAPEESDPSAAFEPLAERSGTTPVARLAARIADTIAHWIATGERLASSARPITPGDVIILVRKRGAFAAAMVAELKRRNIAVAGADRMRLAEQIAVKDLMALGDVLTLPEDDLALATVLKSPLFGLADDDLIALAPERPGTLWSALLAAADSTPRLVEAATVLKRWRQAADYLPPYEFLAGLLERDGMRTRLLARLGPDAADPLDELLELALTYDDRAPPSLQAFIHWLRVGQHEIKRDMEPGRNQVRVMTVHGAKGLEAPVVILADTCADPAAGRSPPIVILAPEPSTTGDADQPQRVWPVSGAGKSAALTAARHHREAREIEEHNRLLYVAMTRARDRLYIGGFESSKGLKDTCWYRLIETALADRLVGVADHAGRPVRRLDTPQASPLEPASVAHASHIESAEPPTWARDKAPVEAALTVPIAPSRLAPLDADSALAAHTLDMPVSETDAAGPKRTRATLTDDPPLPSPHVLAGDSRFLRGTLTHALLQHLPELALDRWAEAATAFVDARAEVLPRPVRHAIVAETLAVLRHPAFRPVFGPNSRAEVAITAEIPDPAGKRAALQVNGQIDRLVVDAGTVLIVDFKTNRPPPAVVDQIPTAYLLQLAAYRLVAAQLNPGLSIRAALLWTDGPRLMEIPERTLLAHQQMLWRLDELRLDAV